MLSRYFLLYTWLWCLPLSAQQQPEKTDPGPADFTLASARAYAEEMWATVPERLSRIQPPTFPKRDFPVAASAQNARPAIMAAMKECSKAGGGRVVLARGDYHSKGPIHLESNVNLHLEEGAKLTFSQDHLDYTPLVKVRWEGTVAYNFSPFIYAIGKENVAITGKGTIDGGAERWSRQWRERQKPDKQLLRQMGNDGIPEAQRVFGNGFLDLDGDGADDGYGSGKLHYLRPTLVELYECKNVLIEGVTLTGSCFWTTHPVFSQNVTVRGIEVYGGYLNDDGIDPDSCEDVLIEDCYVETEDDAISIKAGRDQDAWARKPSRNIIIHNNRLASGVNALCVGSEMSGGVHEVFAENCSLLAGKHALNFKSNLDRGGQVSDVFIRNIKADTLDEALFIFRMDYHGYRGNDFPTQFRDFYVQNVRADHVRGQAFKIVGVASANIEDVLLDGIRVNSAAHLGVSEFSEDILLNHVSVNDRQVSEFGRYTDVRRALEELGNYAAHTLLDEEGKSRCDYNMTLGEWFPYEEPWHTGQLINGLLEAHRVTGRADFLSAATRAGDWWTGLEIADDPSMNGMLRAIHGDSHGEVIVFATVTDGTAGIFRLSEITGEPRYADVATRAGDWMLTNMCDLEQGVCYDNVDPATGEVITEQSDRRDEFYYLKRPNNEGGLFLDMYRHTGEERYKEAFLALSNSLIEKQDEYGLWMDYRPNNKEAGSYHPRFNLWYAESLLDAYELSGERKYLAAGLRTIERYRKASAKDGAIYYKNFVDGSYDSGSITGSAVAFLGMLMLRVEQLSPTAVDYTADIERNVDWVLANRFATDHPDPNLAGAMLNFRVRKSGMKWIVNRDVGTSFALRFLAAYAESLQTTAR